MTTRAPITTHILNLDSGRPAAGVSVHLFRLGDKQPLVTGVTNSDGRVGQWSAPFSVDPGVYRLSFAVAEWFASQGQSSFYPQVEVYFNVGSDQEHYHVPLLLNRFGYSTYRGS
ncbi:hydroxyisourate hydrolase [Marinimicrobium sp. C6131]|uniref:hydroxyisourate hydrolase n=1 Tax=Marinimicrobium sp. C6131 TaxID=3022676 RepID=UPI00223D2825|nr:hydroxyisourate hydrolase [Marinimicrobium sp. C6131]UZJ44042.1 hydroxyisourate hydrolase [Marinimicrobium sp. C6131]